MPVHKRYQPPSKARLERIRLRQHLTRSGVPKVKYTPAEADQVVWEMNQRVDRLPVQSYACPYCGWMHVGGYSKAWLRHVVDPVVILESGERVDACIRSENFGSQRLRLEAILQRCRSAQERAVAGQPSPRRTTPLP